MPDKPNIQSQPYFPSKINNITSQIIEKLGCVVYARYQRATTGAVWRPVARISVLRSVAFLVKGHCGAPSGYKREEHRKTLENPYKSVHRGALAREAVRAKNKPESGQIRVNLGIGSR